MVERRQMRRFHSLAKWRIRRYHVIKIKNVDGSHVENIGKHATLDLCG